MKIKVEGEEVDQEGSDLEKEDVPCVSQPWGK